MFCQNCGNKLSDTASFCEACGTKVVRPTAAPAAVVAQEEPPPKVSPAPAYHSTGKKHSRSSWSWTTTWKGECSACNTPFEWSKVSCPECGKGSLDYWRDTHYLSEAEAGKSRSWYDCYLKCRTCAHEFKGLVCPKCGIAIPMSKIDVLLPVQNMGMNSLIALLIAAPLALVGAAVVGNPWVMLVTFLIWFPIVLLVDWFWPRPKKWLRYVD